MNQAGEEESQARAQLVCMHPGLVCFMTKFPSLHGNIEHLGIPDTIKNPGTLR